MKEPSESRAFFKRTCYREQCEGEEEEGERYQQSTTCIELLNKETVRKADHATSLQQPSSTKKGAAQFIASMDNIYGANVEEMSEAFDCVEAFGYGNFQIGVLFFAVLNSWVMRAHTLAFPLISSELDHWCKKPANANVSDEAWKSLALPLRDDGRHSQCTVYASADDPNDTTVVECDQWDYDAAVAHTTIMSSWDLVCQRRWLLAVGFAVYMAGSLGFLVVGGPVTDIIGRKLTILGATSVLMLAAFGGCFANTYLIYLSTRFLISGCSAMLCVGTCVLLAEVSTNRHRAVHVSFSIIAGVWLGDACFAVLHEVRLNWIVLQLLMVAPTVFLPLGCVFIRESPRWLIARHDLKLAEVVIHAAARTNGFPEEGACAFMEWLRGKELEHARVTMGTEPGQVKNLLTSAVLRRGIVVSATSFTASGAYFAIFLTYAARKKPWTRWLSLAADVAFGALYLAVVDRMSRVNIASTVFTLAGISSCFLALVLNTGVPEEFGIPLLILAKGVTGVGTIIIALCAIETFPSTVRGSGCCLYFACARLGGMLASGSSILRAAGREDLLLVITAGVLFLSAHVIGRLPRQATAFHQETALNPCLPMTPAETVKKMKGTLEPRPKARIHKKRHRTSAVSSLNSLSPSKDRAMSTQFELMKSPSIQLG